MFGYRIPGDDIVGDFASVEDGLQILARQWQKDGVYRDSRVVQAGAIYEDEVDGWHFAEKPAMYRCEVGLEGLVTWKNID